FWMMFLDIVELTKPVPIEIPIGSAEEVVVTPSTVFCVIVLPDDVVESAIPAGKMLVAVMPVTVFWLILELVRIVAEIPIGFTVSLAMKIFLTVLPLTVALLIVESTIPFRPIELASTLSPMVLPVIIMLSSMPAAVPTAWIPV